MKETRQSIHRPSDGYFGNFGKKDSWIVERKVAYEVSEPFFIKGLLMEFTWLPTKRTCDCPDGKLNCLTGAQLIELGSTVIKV